MTDMPKSCPECGELMREGQAPKDRIIPIPFTKLEIILRNWNHTEYYCLCCIQDQEQDRQRRIYDSGLSDGYARGYQDAERCK